MSLGLTSDAHTHTHHAYTDTRKTTHTHTYTHAPCPHPHACTQRLADTRTHALYYVRPLRISILICLCVPLSRSFPLPLSLSLSRHSTCHFTCSRGHVNAYYRRVSRYDIDVQCGYDRTVDPHFRDRVSLSSSSLSLLLSLSLSVSLYRRVYSADRGRKFN